VDGVGGRKPETPGLPSLTLSPAPATQPDIDRQTYHYAYQWTRLPDGTYWPTAAVRGGRSRGSAGC